LKSLKKQKRKRILIAAALFLVVAIVASLVLSGVVLTLFNIVRGNNVYALQVTYVPSVDSFGAVKVAFNLNVIQTPMPIETALTGYSVHVDTAASFVDSAFSITLDVSATVADQISVYSHTFTFQDGQARTVTCYLQDYNVWQYPALNATVGGFTLYQGSRIDFNKYGGQWTH
jgi:hypothetical protein